MTTETQPAFPPRLPKPQAETPIGESHKPNVRSPWVASVLPVTLPLTTGDPATSRGGERRYVVQNNIASCWARARTARSQFLTAAAWYSSFSSQPYPRLFNFRAE